MTDETEKCPCCSETMEPGYVAGWRGVHWRRKEWGLPSIALDQGEPLGPHASSTGSGFVSGKIPHVTANRCTKCKIVLIRYGKEKCVH